MVSELEDDVVTVVEDVLELVQVPQRTKQDAATFVAKLSDTAVARSHWLESITWHEAGSSCPLQIGEEVVVVLDTLDVVALDVLVVLDVHVSQSTGHSRRRRSPNGSKTRHIG